MCRAPNGPHEDRHESRLEGRCFLDEQLAVVEGSGVARPPAARSVGHEGEPGRLYEACAIRRKEERRGRELKWMFSSFIRGRNEKLEMKNTEDKTKGLSVEGQ